MIASSQHFKPSSASKDLLDHPASLQAAAACWLSTEADFERLCSDPVDPANQSDSAFATNSSSSGSSAVLSAAYPGCQGAAIAVASRPARFYHQQAAIASADSVTAEAAIGSTAPSYAVAAGTFVTALSTAVSSKFLVAGTAGSILESSVVISSAAGFATDSVAGSKIAEMHSTGFAAWSA